MTEKFVIIVLLAVCADATFDLPNDPFYCYATDPLKPQIAMFGTTTPYDRVSDLFINPIVSVCKPARVWYVGRHGSRYPSAPDGDNLLKATDTINKEIWENYLSRETTLCLPDAQLIRDWVINPNFTLLTPGALTETGWNEETKIAERLQRAFPTLFPKVYNQNYYYFRHSPILRTRDTARAFARGLFGEGKFDSVTYEAPPSVDNYLVPFNTCPVWSSFYQNMSEVEIFAQTSDYKEMIQQVSNKLGFYGSRSLSADMVDKLITHCKYERIYSHIKPSAFCAAFSVANHQVNEYYRDLSFYYLFGYGNQPYRKLYENMSCYLVQAMLQFLQSNNPSDQKAKLWFAHDATLQLMFMGLGLFEDEVPLTGSNFEQQINRKWKSTFLTPMGGNFAVIRFDCPGGDNDLLFLHNENPMKIPGCKANGVCKQSLIMQRYSRYLNANCDSVFCTNN